MKNTSEIKFCTKCFYNSEHPLKITFDSQGVCSGCRVHEEKFSLDWKKRLKQLKKIVNKFKNKNFYDCIVPVTGAKDSFFILDVVKNKLGLNPLLVNYNIHHNTLNGLRNIGLLRTLFDCDYIQKTVEPNKIRRINQATFDKFGSIYWHVLAGSTTFPVQIATKYKIPLIIWGVHQGCDQVGMFSHLDEVEMTRKYRKEHDLMGFEAEDLLGEGYDLTENDLLNYYYPSNKDISKVGVIGVYLSNYIKWDTKKQHEEMLKKYKYETVLQERTFDSYNNIDCIHYNGIHDYIKLIKCGYSKITDHVIREMRFNRLQRDEGALLINHYESKNTKDLDLLLNFNKISYEKFNKICEKIRNKKLWRKKNNKFSLKFRSKSNKKNNLEQIEKRLSFFKTKPSIIQDKSKYNLFNKSWVDKSK
tara:strand:+ start:264 stop:1514 length:1251 start_codon:yes stop_codon:yes gene_type:complete